MLTGVRRNILRVGVSDDRSNRYNRRGCVRGLGIGRWAGGFTNGGRHTMPRLPRSRKGGSS